MPAFNQAQLNYLARNSNSVTVMIGDVVLCFAQSTTMAVDAGGEALYGVGSQLPQEIQQLRFSPSISVEFFELTSAGSALLENGTSLELIIFNNQFDLHVVDGSTNTTMFTFVDAVATGFSTNMPSNRPIVTSVTFLAMDVVDTTGKSILNGNSAFSIASLVAGQGSAVGLGV